MLLLNNRFN